MAFQKPNIFILPHVTQHNKERKLKKTTDNNHKIINPLKQCPMKTKIFLSILALGLIVSVFGQKPIMELTFTAENNGQYIPLDSIFIENLTQGGDTTLYVPDTVLILNYISGINDNEAIGENTFSVSQNYPNPFKEKTEVHLYLPKKEYIKITVRDILGSELTNYEKTLNRGNHSFSFYSANQKYYLLTVTGKKTSKTIKMLNSDINTAYAGKCKIAYNGYDDNMISYKFQKEGNDFGFNLGDELKYTAYTAVGETEINDAPTVSQIYTFQFTSIEPCPGTPTVTDVDGNVYNTVQIGDQCWMKENLNVGIKINGDQEMQDNSTIEKYCYDDNETNCDIYGGLYQWNEMMQYTTQEDAQGICPSGWHLPTDAEWKQLEMHLGMSQSEADDTGWRGTDEGEKMKSISGWYNNGNGTNSSGFTALPGGYRYNSGSFYTLGSYGLWWSSTECSGTLAWYRGLDYDFDQVSRYDDYKTHGFSVRCLKDF